MADDKMMEVYLETMDEILEQAKGSLFSTKKAYVDVEQIRDCIDQIRMHMPTEVQQAKKIVQERKSIIDEANKQAENIVTRAESRAAALVANSEITKAAEAKAAEIEKQAVAKARAVKNATDEYIVDMLTKTQDMLSANLEAVKRTKNTIKAPKAINPNLPVNQNIQR